MGDFLLLGTAVTLSYLLYAALFDLLPWDYRSFDVFMYNGNYSRWLCICLWFWEINIKIPFLKVKKNG